MSSKKIFIAILIICLLSIITLGIFGVATFFPSFQDWLIKKPEQSNLETPSENPVSPSYGPDSAKIKIVVFGDFLCPISKATSKIISELATNYPNDVKITWKDFPNTTLHPNSDILAGAARCAQKEGKFWKFHDLLFENQKTLSAKNSSSILLSIADKVGLNRANFINCISTEETLSLVQDDFNEGSALKITGTPYLFINDIIKINGAVTYEELESYLK